MARKKEVKNDLTNTDKKDMILVKQKRHYKKKGSIFGYTSRLVAYMIIFSLITAGSIYFINKSIKIHKTVKINYEEKSNLDYKVKVKENDFYENEYLDKNMSYIANLIDTIDINFNYDFNTDTEISGKYSYRVIGEVEILNSETNELFFSKTFDLLKRKEVQFDSKKDYSINENIKINYDYYNKIANSFKTQYAISSISCLKVYLEVARDVDDDLIKNNDLDGNSKMLVTIPLSEKAISIKLDYNNISNKDSIISKHSVDISDVKSLGIGVAGIIIAIVVFIKFAQFSNSLIVKKSSYDKYIKKILREYDRLIVKTENIPNLNHYTVIKVTNFEELLDARDNLHKPICYVEVVPHNICYFFIKDEKDLYFLTIKDTDIEQHNK